MDRKNKIIRQVINALQTGLTARKAALSIVLGVIWGLFPILGGGALLCLGSSALLKLNLPVMWVSSMLVTPLQWLMIVPFTISGKFLLGQSSESMNIANHPASFFGIAALAAGISWAIFSILAGFLLYAPTLRKVNKWQRASTELTPQL